MSEEKQGISEENIYDREETKCNCLNLVAEAEERHIEQIKQI